MKNFFCTLAVMFMFHTHYSQIICIDCLKQNTRVSTNVTDKVSNGSFEISNCTPWSYQGVFCPNSNYFTCSLNSWTCTGGGTGSYPCLMTNTVCVIVDGARAAYLGNSISASACATSQADTSCIGVSQCTVAAPPAGFPVNTAAYGGTTGVSIEQNITGLTVGANYVLEFWAGGEKTNSTHLYRGLFAVDIGFGKTFLRCLPTGTTDVGNRYVIQFKPTATSHTIKFTNWGHIGNNFTEVVLDDIRLYAQSELGPGVNKCGVTTGVNELSSESLLFFPNPFSSCTELRTDRLHGYTTVKLLQVTGEAIKSWETIPAEKLQICREELAAGLYYLVVEAPNKKQVVQKLVISD